LTAADSSLIKLNYVEAGDFPDCIQGQPPGRDVPGGFFKAFFETLLTAFFFPPGGKAKFHQNKGGSLDKTQKPFTLDENCLDVGSLPAGGSVPA
jgi:hypothetical protein